MKLFVTGVKETPIIWFKAFFLQHQNIVPFSLNPWKEENQN